MAGDAGGTLSILVVEDDQATAELIRSLFNDVPGWGAIVVHDAAAARELVRHVRIEVLVLDLNLPGISGLELLALLRRDPHWNEPPVILMSADLDPAGVQAALTRAEAGEFIAKPFDLDQLVRAVEVALTTDRYRPERPLWRAAQDRAEPGQDSPAQPAVESEHRGLELSPPPRSSRPEL